MHDLQRYLVEEFADDYLEGQLSRRDLFRRVLLMTGSVAVTASALSALGVRSRKAQAATPPRPSTRLTPADPAILPDLPADGGTAPPPAQTNDNVVDPADPAIQAQMVTFPGAEGDVFAYLAQPAVSGVYPAVIVIHENRGLIEPNMDIARRYAREGFIALAVDLVSRAGGTNRYLDDLTQAIGFLGRTRPDDLVSDVVSGLTWLAAQPAVDAAHIGATGFCFGGGIVWRLTTVAPTLKAAVPYYGSNPPLELVPQINAAVLGIYAEGDPRTTSNSDALFDALAAAGKTADRWVAPSANHAFFNNTNTAYAPAAAMEAWDRTLKWFRQYLTE